MGRLLLGLGEVADESTDRAELEQAESALVEIRMRLHAGIVEAHPEAVLFTRAREEHGLVEVDVEILLLLVLLSLGLLQGCYGMIDVSDLQKRLQPCEVDPLDVVRALAPGTSLVASGLVRLTEGDRPVDSKVALAPEFLQSIWRKGPLEPWQFRTESDAFGQLRRLVLAARKHVAELAEDESVTSGGEQAAALPGRLNALYSGFVTGLEVHPGWPLARALAPLAAPDGLVLLLLLARDLGHVAQADGIFRGAGLAASISKTPLGARDAVGRLRKDATLRASGLIRPCGGLPSGVVVEDEAVLREAEFELTRSLRKELGVRRPWRSGTNSPRDAVVRLDQLVLHDEVGEAIRQAVCHARNPGRLLDEWGLRKVMPYGSGTTLLFTGPPGVGKTAAAEGIANELGRQLLTIDYSSIQSCWVGETEKQVVRAFREAADEDAVLFWDEADAMFFDRDSATHNWEAREVNVLLKEIEAFEGVCILATNRSLVLAPALERRLTRSLRFEPPSPEMGVKIWRLMIPEELPLADEINFFVLGRLGLTGGQIKNTVMEAARRAVARKGAGKVRFQDLLEIAERRAPHAGRARIGFSPSRHEPRLRKHLEGTPV